MAPNPKPAKQIPGNESTYSSSRDVPMPPPAPPTPTPPVPATPPASPVPSVPTSHITSVLAEINKRVAEAHSHTEKMVRLEKIVTTAVPAAMSDVVGAVASLELNIALRLRTLEDLVRGLVAEIAVLVAPVSIPTPPQEPITLPSSVGKLSSSKPNNAPPTA
jgi:hypothetical protein